ncbi:hypothetical protein [Shinella sp. M31]|uniref:hypothetical protein n=1 Tax=Shinella sp. M31 TaxID=3368615 RepID=UPI003B9DF2F4
MPRFTSPTDASAYATEFGGYLSRDGLECLHIFDGSLERSLLNLAPGKPVPDGVVGGGTPAIGTGSAWLEVSGTNWIEVSATDSLNQTIYSVVKSAASMADDNNRPTYWANGLNFPANGESANSFGNRLVVTAATAERFGAGFGNDTTDDETTTTSVAATHNTWHLLVCKIIATGSGQGVSIQNITAGTSVATATTAKPRFPVIGRYRIGSQRSGAQIAGSQQKWWMKYSKVTNADEDARNIAQIREYQLKRWGIVV